MNVILRVFETSRVTIHPANERHFVSRPQFRAALAAAAGTWSLESSRHGAPVPVRVADGRWLLSRYDPEKETARWLATQNIAPDELPVFIGFNPYIPGALVNRPIVMVEKDAGLVAACLAGMDLGVALEGVSIVLDESGYQMMSAVRNANDVFRHRRLRLLPLPTAEDTAWVKSVLEHGVKIQRELSLNAISYSCQLPKWISTVRANLATMMNGPDGRSVYGSLNGATAILVGAGPSLEKNIDQLAACRGRALIIAVDTALRRLDRAGIIPDVTVAVDANDANARDVDGLGERLLEESILAADPIVAPAVVRAFRGPRTFFRSINFTFDLEGNAVPMVEPLDFLLHEIAGRNVIAAWQSGGSVSTNAFNLCHLLGVSRVVLVGQDLAFTEGRAHSSGVGHEDEHAGRMLGRFRSREMLVRMATRDGDFLVPGWNGGMVRTNEVLREYLNWFEMTMEHGFGRVFAEVIDASEGGASKKGMTRSTLADALKRLPETGDPAVALRRALAGAEPAGAPGWERRVVAFVEKLRRLAGASPEAVTRELPLAPWLVLPAWIGSFDMDPEDRRAVQSGGISSAVDFLLKVFSGMAAEFEASARFASSAGGPAPASPRSATTAAATAPRAPSPLPPEPATPAGLHVTAAADGSPILALATGTGVRHLDASDRPAATAQQRVDQLVAGGLDGAGPEGARPEMLVIVGVGLGYELEAAVARRELTAIVLVEPDAGAIRRARKIRNLEHALADPRVTTFIAEKPRAIFEQLAARFDHGMESGRHLVVLPRARRIVHPSCGLDPSALAAVEEQLDALLVVSERNRRTLARFAEPWRRNILANIPAILAGGRLADLEGAAKGVPAVLLAAGPSLDGVLGELRLELEKRGAARPLVVVVDTALRAVARAGITPDLVVAVDASDENLGDFEGVSIDQDRTALVYVPVVHPAIPALFARRFATSYGHPVQVWLEEATGRAFGSLSISGSVATLAYDLLRYLGAKPIILAGLDLAVGVTGHTRGALTGQGEGRFATTETRTWKHARGATVRRPGWGGGNARTTEQMLRWIEWFEGELLRRPWPTINATGGGARLEGAQEMGLVEALKRHPAKPWSLPAPRPFTERAQERVRRSLAAIRDGVPDAEPLLSILLRWDLCVSGAVPAQAESSRVRGSAEQTLCDDLRRQVAGVLAGEARRESRRGEARK